MAGDQRLDALERAQEVRLARAEIKRELKRGEIGVAEILRPGSKVPDPLKTMAVAELLSAQNRWGATRSRGVLQRVEIREHRQVGELTTRQRRVLTQALAGASQAVTS